MTRMFTGSAGAAEPVRRRVSMVVSAVAVLGLTGLAATTPAQAAVKKAAATAAIRAAHFSPTTPGVDVYLGSFNGKTSAVWVSGVRYGAVSPYRQIKPGLYTVSMRRHGMSTSSAAMLSWTLDARAGHAYTVAGVGAGSNVRGIVIPDDLSTPSNGTGRVRVIQAASRAPALTVQATSGPTIVRGAKFATTTGYATVPAGTWQVAASSDANPSLRASSAIKVAAGQIESVIVLDAKTSGITVRGLLDSASSGATPTGPVPAGGGATATSFTSSNHLVSNHLVTPALLALAASMMISVFTVGRRNRRRPARHAADNG